MCYICFQSENNSFTLTMFIENTKLCIPIMTAAILICSGCADKDEYSIQTPILPIADIDNSGHNVTLNQVISYANRNSHTTKGGECNYRIEPYQNAAGDTLMYIINYGDNEGWQVLSSDKRTPAIIAEGYTGRFSIKEGSEGFRLWMDRTATDIETIRNSSDEELSFSAEEIAANRAFWADDHKISQQRGLNDPILPPNGGMWVEEVTTRVVDYDSLGHLTPQWHQEAPYNSYCPLKTVSPAGRAFVGCVATAGAETLYYLHSIYGIPASIESRGFCYGAIDNYIQSFFNPTTTAWSFMQYTMQTSYADAEAVLLGHVGKTIDTIYGNDGSEASLYSLENKLFEPYGIHCDTLPYVADTVKKYILLNQPIIVAAKTDTAASTPGHCFVIDGYKRTCIEYTHYTYWQPGPGIDPLDPPYYEPIYHYFYSNPTLSYIKINWGWKSQWEYGINDGWFGLTEDWYVNLHYYNVFIGMVFGFHV